MSMAKKEVLSGLKGALLEWDIGNAEGSRVAEGWGYDGRWDEVWLSVTVAEGGIRNYSGNVKDRYSDTKW